MFTKYNFEIAGLLPSNEDAMIHSAAGVYVSPERTMETDGHQAVIVTVPENQPSLFTQPDGLEEAQFFTPFLMDRESALKLAKMMPKRSADAPENSMAMIDVHTEAESDATIAVTEDVRRSIFKTIKRSGEKFPQLDNIMPDPSAARFEVQLNGDVFVPVLKMFQKFAGDDSAVAKITMRLYGADKGIRFDAEGPEGQKMAACIMPLRMTEAV